MLKSIFTRFAIPGLYFLTTSVIWSQSGLSGLAGLSDRLTAAASVQEELKREAVKQQPLEVVVPEFIIGGEWSSTLRLTNQGTAAISLSKAVFLDNLGRSVSATFQITGGGVIT